MAELSNAENTSEASPEKKRLTSWVGPAVTAAILAAVFCTYYFVYVAAQREYLINRNFRSLAVLGQQLQTLISTHGSILEYHADLSEPSRHPTHRRQKQSLEEFVVDRPEDKALPAEDREFEARRDYLKFLAPNFELATPKNEDPGKAAPSRFDIQRRNGHWELVFTAERHKGSVRDYIGSLQLDDLPAPLVRDLPFDDILLVAPEGNIVYQMKKAGPQFTTLTSLLQAQTSVTEAKPAGQTAEDGGRPKSTTPKSEQTGVDAILHNADPAWRVRSMHLADLTLAGTRYKLFLQPVLMDVYSDEADQHQSAREFVLCGMESARVLEWEALSISYTFIIWFTAIFFAICAGGPVLKAFFMNHREHFRLRELAFLGIFLVLLAGVLTLCGLQMVNLPLHDDTDARLQKLGDKLASTIHLELHEMNSQLVEWCKDPQLNRDLQAVATERMEIARVVPPKQYAHLNNMFWTDDNGHQVVKWGAGTYMTPMIDVSDTTFYTHARTAHLDAWPQPFHFESVLPPNRIEYLAGIIMSTSDCNPALASDKNIRGDLSGGSAALTAQSLSLIDPILPGGFGFALVDENGLVMFHADKTRNTRENFRQESDWNRQLYAATFAHSQGRALSIKYKGKDYRARVQPLIGLSQAPWSLVVYGDLSPIRTMSLQCMTMSATLLLFFLAGPVVIIAIWWAMRRPRFAPEWLWPHEGRLAAYSAQIVCYGALMVLFLVLVFAGSNEQTVIACAAVPYCAMLATWWCFHAYPCSSADAPPPKHSGKMGLAAVIPVLIAIACFWRLPGRFAWIPLLGVTVAAQPPGSADSSEGAPGIEHDSEQSASGLRACRNRYVLSVLLLLVLLGVLLPMALFRTSLSVERRLALKQAQLHLASSLAQRLNLIGARCESQELGETACADYRNASGTAWSRMVFDPLYQGRLPLADHSSTTATKELYNGWFQKLVYSLHHDYNDAAAEMLGVIPDRATGANGDHFPDWFWDDNASEITLRWHGVHMPAAEGQAARKGTPLTEQDFLIRSAAPAATWGEGLSCVGVGLAIAMVLGGILWPMVRKLFLFNVSPLKMTGARQVAEAVRAGRSMVILLPPVSEWQLDAPTWTIDLADVSPTPDWAETMDLSAAPLDKITAIRHFEQSFPDASVDNQKFVLLQRLLAANTQIAVVMTVPVSSKDYRQMFPDFGEVIDLREEPFPWLKQYAGPCRDLIWSECGPVPALWPIGAQLAKDIRTEVDPPKDLVVSEVLERADGYYRLVWKDCTDEQRFVLTQLAGDGLLNPTNGRSIRQLVRRGLITKDPQFRIVNESFRRFLQSAASAKMQKEWLRESRSTGWGKAHGAFFTTMAILGIFLLTTQNSLWESSAAYVTTAFGALGTLARLFNTYKTTGTPEKAG